MKRMKQLTLMMLGLIVLSPLAMAAGTLTAIGSPQQPIEIRDHHTNVVINNGFAETEVTQTFFNPNAQDLEAIYAFPVPESASLSEVTIYQGDLELNGEVVEAEEAERIYQEEKDKGNDAGLTSKEEYKRFEFRIARVPAQGETKIRFLYYQPIKIDTGAGRYVYPLQDGETDEAAKQFWSTNEVVSGSLSIDVELKSAWPVERVRVTGRDDATTVTQLAEGHYKVHYEETGASLSNDFVFYYLLKPDLPGRMEMLTYREQGEPNGTFMMVLTPGVDLQPITQGVDYMFVLDVSGSMRGKLQTLVDGVQQALGRLRPEDRFYIVTFSNNARSITRDWTPATAGNVKEMASKLNGLDVEGGTNLHEGLSRGLHQLDADRPTCFILVTDAVANAGETDPAAFHKLMTRYDIRFFGFLIGNGGNWPLMNAICHASGGYFKQVSTADDIIGQIMLAKGKITHEALHEAKLEIDGVKTFDTSNFFLDKIYHGEQLVLFGRYSGSGDARVTLKARKTGQDLTYQTTVRFPDQDRDHPELERMWALDQIEEIELFKNAGLLNPDEARDGITAMGLSYQLVTDHTSMLLLTDEAFAQHGVDRRNRDRIAREQLSKRNREPQSSGAKWADQSQPMFNQPAPSWNSGGGSGGGGAGAMDPLSMGLMLTIAAGAAMSRRRKDEDEAA